MTREPAKNPAASIRARLLALAQSKGQDYQRVLGRYANRTVSVFVWAARPTATDSRSREQRCLRSGRAIPTGPRRTWISSDRDRRPFVKSRRQFGPFARSKGMTAFSLTANQSREQGSKKRTDEYEGVRVKFHAVLAGARIPMQVDIGFGDAVYPEPEFASFPVLLPMEPPVIRAYPREAAIAEKLNAMVVLDIRNSRMKDFYDIWFMANTWTFEMATLSDATGWRSSSRSSRAIL